MCKDRFVGVWVRRSLGKTLSSAEVSANNPLSHFFR